MSATIRTSSRIQARKNRRVSGDAEQIPGTRKRKSSKDEQAPATPQTTPAKKSAAQNVTTPSASHSSGEPHAKTAASTQPGQSGKPVTPSTTGSISTRSSQRGTSSSVIKNDAPSKTSTSTNQDMATSPPVSTLATHPVAATSGQCKAEPSPQGGVDTAAQIVPQALPPTHIFKNPNFTHSGRGGLSAGKKTRTWKTLKQIIASERAQLHRPIGSTYSSIDAPPSLRPPKKYSDISGLPAKYTDPRTKLRYANTEEFAQLRMLPQDIVNGLLALRRANLDVQ